MKNYQMYIIVILVFLILILLSYSWKYFGSALARAMAFLGPNDILIAEKNTGNIIRAVNGVISPQRILHVSATKKDERVCGR